MDKSLYFFVIPRYDGETANTKESILHASI